MLRKQSLSLLQSFVKNGNKNSMFSSVSNERFYAKKNQTKSDKDQPENDEENLDYDEMIASQQAAIKKSYKDEDVNELTGRKFGDFSKPSKLASHLQKKGKFYENIHKKLSNTTLVQRVLFNKLNENDFKDTDFRNPDVLKEYMNLFAREGPQELVLYKHKPEPVTVTVTGAAGQIAYSLLTRIGNGDMLGKDQMVKLRLLERPEAMKALEGTIMEIKDCAFPNIVDIHATDNYDDAFDGCDYAILVGAKPRGPGMERGDLLKENANLFAEQGKALNRKANKDVLVTVVGNPANTNALVCALNARDIPKSQFSALTRLDHDRGLALIAEKANCDIKDIHRFCVWGNHSATMYPDLTHSTINGEWALRKINDMNWVYNEFIPRVQQRGAEIISARGKSSAASAADATIKHVHDWVRGNTRWVSMAMYSDGVYRIPSKIFTSYPVLCKGSGEVGIVKGLPIDRKSADLINKSNEELLMEREAISHLLPSPVYRLADVDVNKVFSKDYIFSEYKKSTGKDVDTL